MESVTFFICVIGLCVLVCMVTFTWKKNKSWNCLYHFSSYYNLQTSEVPRLHETAPKLWSLKIVSCFKRNCQCAIFMVKSCWKYGPLSIKKMWKNLISCSLWHLIWYCIYNFAPWRSVLYNRELIQDAFMFKCKFGPWSHVHVRQRHLVLLVTCQEESHTIICMLKICANRCFIANLKKKNKAAWW